MPRIAIAVNDYAGAIETFRDVLGMPVLDFSEHTVPALGAHVGMCMPEGGSNIELMSPSNPDLPLSQSLQKFLDSRGEGFYALMLEAEDPDAEAEQLLGRGMGVLPLMAGAGGRDIHPRTTHGVLIRVYPNDSVGQHEGVESSEPSLSGIATAVIATTDAAQAVAAYGTGLGLEVEPVTIDDERGVSSVLCRPPKGGVIELVSAVNTDRPYAGRIAKHVASRGEGIYSLELRAGDPKAAALVLAERGLEMSGEGGLETSVFGARLVIA